MTIQINCNNNKNIIIPKTEYTYSRWDNLEFQINSKVWNNILCNSKGNE
jgi:hypothetical protein